MGLMPIPDTNMPTAYVEFTDGTMIAVPLAVDRQYTPVAKVHIVLGDGKTVEVSPLSVDLLRGRLFIVAPDIAPVPASASAP